MVGKSNLLEKGLIENIWVSLIQLSFEKKV